MANFTRVPAVKDLLMLVFVCSGLVWGLSLFMLWFRYRGPGTRWMISPIALFRPTDWAPGSEPLRKVALASGGVAIAAWLVGFAIQELSVR